MHFARLFLLLLFFVPAYGSPESDACQKQVEKIDAEIKKLSVQKQKHLDLAAQYQKQGDNWQYSSGRIEDAHQAWDKANQEQKAAIDLQGQIDSLNEQKQRIYQFYPELYQP